MGAGTANGAFAQSEHVVPPQKDWSDPVSISMKGNPTYFHRHRLEVEGVPAAEQAIYQSSWAGELGLRIAGLQDKPYRVHLAYTEMDMNAPWIRVFDVLINGEVVKREVCIFKEVGNRRVLNLDFNVRPQGGVITYAQRKSVPEADFPSFTLIQIYDEADRLVGQKSAYEMRPSDWDLNGYLDKIYFGPIKNDHDAPPWQGTYKLRANQPEKLTAADVIGPDGIAYPNWTNVGLPGGIPRLAITRSAADFGAKPDDAGDDSAALQKAIDAVQADGGGVLLIPEGRYYLDRPIYITGDNVVLRGAGMKRTRLISRFSMQGKAPEIQGLSAISPIGPTGFYYLWIDPQGLTGIEIKAGDKLVSRVAKPGLWETQVFYRYTGAELLAAAGPGKTTLTVTVSYRDGSKRSASMPAFVTDRTLVEPRAQGVLGMIMFQGTGLAAEKIFLTAGGKRGDMSLELPAGHGLQAGDRIALSAPVTAEWKKIHRDDHVGGTYRMNMYDITSVHGNRITLPEALRLDFPLGEAYVQRLHPQLHCGVEDLGIEQAVDTRVHTVVFEYGWESWVRGLEVVRTGDKALYMPHAKRCEVRDSVFDRAWVNGGGSAYIGWEHSFDSLMENVTTIDMRHAPVVQWSTSGCVIRNSVFHNSDAQWHAGWTNENLYEGLVVESSQDGGSYGNGMWASGPEDTGHGPNGPRNVIYNCNITSSKGGLWMGGMNEAWLILHNRFVVGRGPAVIAKAASFDHIIQGNVFVMMEAYPAAIYLASADCTGIELLNNRFYGEIDQLVGGAVRPAVEWDNRVLPSGNINRPQPVVRSIYDWQQEHREEIRALQVQRAGSRKN
ncbi:MAG: hypothetical protein K9N01_10235 [Cephaloticoccus sp.]|nr:hypothetical protein [Cephaloticoccus sp.]